jgi:bisphosphoglycerate-dependent phosphoglycerate mutase
MKNENRFDAPTVANGERSALSLLHPAWRALVRYCAELQHGEIERLKIQDGLPMLAEVTKKKIKFAS